MAIGAHSHIDRLLVEKYSTTKVDNHDEDALVSKVSANDMMNAMNRAGMQSRDMAFLSNRLCMVCYGVVAKSARYTPIEYAA